MDFLRTPDERFENLPDFPYQPNYLEVKELRMHYLDEGNGETILCLHGEPSWSYLYRKFIPILSEDYRVIAPDLIGFGRSDKLPNEEDYSFQFHYDMLHRWVELMQIDDATLVVQDWGGLLGLSLLAYLPHIFKRVVILNTFLPNGTEKPSKAFEDWKAFVANTPDLPIGKIIDMGTTQALAPEIIAAYDAPFPDASYKAGARVFPALVPASPDAQGVEHLNEAREVLSLWDKPALVMFSDGDPITRGADQFFRALIPSAKAQPVITIEGAGHFLQEDRGDEIAGHIRDFIERTPERPVEF